MKHGVKLKKTDGEKLIPEVVKAVIGNQALTRATRPLNNEDRKSLSRAIKMDVDQWRMQFAQKLREASEDLLKLTMDEMENIPPGQRAFALSVLIDKAQLLENRTATHSAQVNVQINNYGDMSKEDILAKLQGQFTVSTQPLEASAEPPPAGQKTDFSQENPG